jgi:hypothetical protein
VFRRQIKTGKGVWVIGIKKSLAAVTLIFIVPTLWHFSFYLLASMETLDLSRIEPYYVDNLPHPNVILSVIPRNASNEDITKLVDLANHPVGSDGCKKEVICMGPFLSVGEIIAKNSSTFKFGSIAFPNGELPNMPIIFVGTVHERGQPYGIQQMCAILNAARDAFGNSFDISGFYGDASVGDTSHHNWKCVFEPDRNRYKLSDPYSWESAWGVK